MRWSKPLTALALATTLAGCESIFGSGDEEPITRLPRALTESEQELIVASNRFGFNLLREVSARDTSSNIFLSPLSASLALGMTMVECNPIALNGEELDGSDFVFEDRGGNACGCADASDSCMVLSANLEPPTF